MSNREFYQALETLVRANASAELARLAGLGRVLLDCATEADAAELLDDWTGRLLLAQALPGWGWGHPFGSWGHPSNSVNGATVAPLEPG